MTTAAVRLARCAGFCLLWTGFLLAGPLAAADAPLPCVQLWEQGQEAMRRGEQDVAIRCYELSLAANPAFSRNYLSLAAAYIEKGDEKQACPHLAHYLETNPKHLVIRAHYAELLLHLHRTVEARAEFGRFVVDAQAEEERHVKELIHCHSRLMAIAEEAEDEYTEHLHRGIGLYLLARQHSGASAPEDDLTPEELYCRAAAELTLARIERPDEAQPCWYLYEVWSGLAQRLPALRCLREAEEAASFTYLTPVEQARLAIARRCHELPVLPR